MVAACHRDRATGFYCLPSTGAQLCANGVQGRLSSAQYTKDSWQDTATSARAARLETANGPLERLLVAIEGLAFSEPPSAFCGRFLLSGDTVQGGQGVVAFARDSCEGMQQFAIKCAPPRRFLQSAPRNRNVLVR